MDKVIFRSREEYIHPEVDAIDQVSVLLTITAWPRLFKLLQDENLIDENGIPTEYAIDQGYAYEIEYHSASGEHIVDSWVLSQDYLNRFIAHQASLRNCGLTDICENVLNGRCDARI